MISRTPEMLTHLSSELGLEDLHDLLEVMRVDAHNAKILDKARKQT